MAAFTVMTWNVQNLFLPSEETGAEGQAAFEQKLDSLAAVVDRARPDILALQEVGPNGALDRLQAALKTPMPHAIEGQPDERGIRVAVLSTRPFASSRHLRPFPELIRPVQARDPAFDDPATACNESLTALMGRGSLEVGLVFNQTPVIVITAHFKSKLISYARKAGVVGGSRFQPNDEGERYRYAAYALYLRTCEALTVRQRLNEILADPDDPANIEAGTGRTTAVVFCGDLNDEVEAGTTQIIKGPQGSEIGTGGFKKQDKGDGFRMWNLAHLLDPVDGQPPYTRMYHGRGELIDHIFASHRLVNPDNEPFVRTLMDPEPLPSIEDDPNARKNEPGSDHAALVATFNI
ncbi:MAG: endonuclease/exonuclease/phosphatase family protein [Desulfosarcinaceae bacterium]